MKIPLNRTELHSLIELLMFANYDNIEDKYVRELVGELTMRLLKRLNRKLLNFPEVQKEAKLSFRPADLAAMYKALKCYRGYYKNTYDGNLALKITMIIELKSA